jgi:hypothetical protein
MPLSVNVDIQGESRLLRVSYRNPNHAIRAPIRRPVGKSHPLAKSPTLLFAHCGLFAALAKPAPRRQTHTQTWTDLEMNKDLFEVFLEPFRNLKVPE